MVNKNIECYVGITQMTNQGMPRPERNIEYLYGSKSRIMILKHPKGTTILAHQFRGEILKDEKDLKKGKKIIIHEKKFEEVIQDCSKLLSLKQTTILKYTKMRGEIKDLGKYIIY